MLPLSTLILTLLLGGGVDRVPGATGGRPATIQTSHFAFRSEPPISEVQVGDAAPNFSYQGFDGRWARLHHMVDQGPVLLVIAPSNAQLAGLERECDAMLGLGVIPVAIVDLKPGQAREVVRRLGLRYTVLSDSRRVIAGQFNAVGEDGMTPSWFVVDGRLRVRALHRGRVPNEDYVRLCARALSLPIPGTLVQTSR